MSNTTQETKEIFAVCKQNVDKYFNEVERSLPQYLQSITNLQQAYTAAWKNATESSISLQQNVKMFNDNVKTLAELNENILQFWISSCIFTRN